MNRTQAPKITEKVFQKQVEQLAKTLGWTYYHTFNSYRSVSGFPDLVMVNTAQRRVVFAELKSDTGKLSDKQREWIDNLTAAGAEAYVWYPGDWDEIVRILQRGDH